MTFFYSFSSPLFNLSVSPLVFRPSLFCDEIPSPGYNRMQKRPASTEELSDDCFSLWMKSTAKIIMSYSNERQNYSPEKSQFGSVF